VIFWGAARVKGREFGCRVRKLQGSFRSKKELGKGI
jgi:hypothetical protein